MKNYIKAKIDMKTGSEGSSLAIALFFFMLCALICAGILFVANSSIFGVSKNFNADDIPEFTEPAPIPTPNPTPEIDPAYQAESEAINYVYDTLAYEFDGMFNAVPYGVDYSILHAKNHGSLSYEIMSYVNAYFGVVYRESGNKYLQLSEKTDSDIYFVDVDATGEMQPKEFKITVSGIDLKVVIDLDGTATSKYNTILKFNKVYFKVSVWDESSGCTYVREYSNSYDDGLFYLKWVGAGSGLPKRFVIKNHNW